MTKVHLVLLIKYLSKFWSGTGSILKYSCTDTSALYHCCHIRLRLRWKWLELHTCNYRTYRIISKKDLELCVSFGSEFYRKFCADLQTSLRFYVPFFTEISPRFTFNIQKFPSYLSTSLKLLTQKYRYVWPKNNSHVRIHGSGSVKPVSLPVYFDIRTQNPASTNLPSGFPISCNTISVTDPYFNTVPTLR
jgi:hypothetical protein